MTKIFLLTLFLAAISCSRPGVEKNAEATPAETSIFPKGDKLPNDYFTGDAYVNRLLPSDKNNDFTLGVVSFEPAARTNWHTHPKGQVLIVISGRGIYQERGTPARHLVKGDVVNIPEETEHWLGAAPDSEFTHLTISNVKDGQTVTWLSRVTDEEYRQPTTQEYLFQATSN